MKFIYNTLHICNSGKKIFQIMMLKQLAIHLEITNLDPYFTLNLHKIQMEKKVLKIFGQIIGHCDYLKTNTDHLKASSYNLLSKAAF